MHVFYLYFLGGRVFYYCCFVCLSILKVQIQKDWSSFQWIQLILWFTLTEELKNLYTHVSLASSCAENSGVNRTFSIDNRHPQLKLWDPEKKTFYIWWIMCQAKARAAADEFTLRRINQSINRLVSKAGVLTLFVAHFHAKGLWDIEITRKCKHMALPGSVPPSEGSKWPIFSHCERYLITVPCESWSFTIDYLCAQ